MRDCATLENHIKKSASEKPRPRERRIARSRRAAATAAPSRLGALETGGVSGLEWRQDRSKAGDHIASAPAKVCDGRAPPTSKKRLGYGTDQSPNRHRYVGSAPRLRSASPFRRPFFRPRRRSASSRWGT